MDVRPGRSLGLLSAAHAVNHAFAVLLPPIFLAIIDEFGVTVQSVAFLAAFGSLASGLVQLSYAELTRHVSRKRLLTAGGLLFGGGFAAMSLASSFMTFAIPNVAARIGGSPQHPVGNGLLAEQYTPERRGFAISAHIAGGNLGTVLIAIVGTPLIALSAGAASRSSSASRRWSSRCSSWRSSASGARTGPLPVPAAAASTVSSGSSPTATCAGCS